MVDERRPPTRGRQYESDYMPNHGGVFSTLPSISFDSEAELDAATEEALPGYIAAEAEYNAERAAFAAELPGHAEQARQAVAAFLRDQGMLPDGVELEVEPLDLQADPLWAAPAPWAQATSAAEPPGVLARIDAAIDDWEHGPDAARWHPDMPQTDDAAPPQYNGILATLNGEYVRPPRCRCSIVPARLEIPTTSVEIEFDTVPMPPPSASAIRAVAEFEQRTAASLHQLTEQWAAIQPVLAGAFEQLVQGLNAAALTLQKLGFRLQVVPGARACPHRPLGERCDFCYPPPFPAAQDYRRRTKHRNRRRK